MIMSYINYKTTTTNTLSSYMHACIEKEGRLENEKFFKLKNRGYKCGIKTIGDKRDGV